MNQSMHFYLSSLVGDAQQLIITTDNAKIPLDLSCSDQNTVSTWGSDDCSMHSRFSSYSNYSQSSSMTDSNTGSQGCRWGDSEGQLNNNNNNGLGSTRSANVERTPKKPLRRPASPTSPCTTNKPSALDEEDHHIDHRRRRRIVECFGDNNNKEDDDMFRTSCRQQKITLMGAVSAKKGMLLRKPQRRASNDGTTTRTSKVEQRRTSSSRNHQRRPRTAATIKAERYAVLGKAICELGMEDELTARGTLTFTSKAPQ